MDSFICGDLVRHVLVLVRILPKFLVIPFKKILHFELCCDLVNPCVTSLLCVHFSLLRKLSHFLVCLKNFHSFTTVVWITMISTVSLPVPVFLIIFLFISLVLIFLLILLSFLSLCSFLAVSITS